jgi:hypothetical protein
MHSNVKPEMHVLSNGLVQSGDGASQCSSALQSSFVVHEATPGGAQIGCPLGL